MNEHLSPLYQAYKEIPKKWYEITYKQLFLQTLGFFAITDLIYNGFSLDVLPVHIASGIAYYLSAIGDRYSTMKGLDAGEEASIYDSRAGFTEANVLARNTKTVEDFTRNRKPLLVDSVLTAVSFFVPPAGFTFAEGKLVAVVNNLRGAKRSARVAEIGRNAGAL